jgi:hypothetical protein
MFYFEESTKNFYIDIVKSRSRVFDKVSLNVSFNFYPNHRSLLASDGEIYILGGYDGHISEENETDYLGLYRLDFHKRLVSFREDEHFMSFLWVLLR